MENELTPLDLDQTFRFDCHRNVACFNECCRDLNQFLTPYDILRLKNGLGMDSSQFLEQYTTRHMGPETGLPIISLKPAAGDRLACPFVTPSGCNVYAYRPSSCRMYPAARAISRSRETGRVSEHFALLREPHCKGHLETKSQTLGAWLSGQKLACYNVFNDMLMDIIALKNRRGPAPLDMKTRLAFHTALYDLDRFREQVFLKELPEDVAVDKELLQKAREDDVALLRLGHAYVAQLLEKGIP